MPDKPADSNVNRTGLAAAMGVSMPTVDAWVRAGCPVVKKGGRGVEWEFSLAAVFEWRMHRDRDKRKEDEPTDLEAIEKRKQLALAQEAELRLAKARGEVAPIVEFERAQARTFAELQTNVMNVAQRVVISLLGETDEARFKKVLRAELALALERTANAVLTLGDDDEEDAG